ncbi:DNA double-strand break repair nuclease NurA [Chloroflexota bacterium]
MSLDFDQVAAQVEHMVSRIKAGEIEREQRLRYALDVLKSTDVDALKTKIERSISTCTWLVAGIHDELNSTYDAIACPADYTAISTDGSHIDADRHMPARCCLINIGSGSISYGENPNAVLANQPALYVNEPFMEGNLLELKRAVDECLTLAQLSEQTPNSSSVVALLDGTLILWGIIGLENIQLVKDLLATGFLKALDIMKERGLPLASYISYPRSADVVNVLRVAICPFETANCDVECRSDRKCNALDDIVDRDLFASTLAVEQRSAIFSSISKIIERCYREHMIYFFYLNVGDEIARVEIPAWVVDNNDLLDRVHTMVLDQCRRGHGYPAVLMEAHEQAVLNGADREQFWRLVEMYLTKNDLPSNTSAKSLSKRTRWI